MPKVGFSNVPFENRFDVLNVKDLAQFKGTVSPTELVKAKLVRKNAKVKILGFGEAPKGLKVVAHKFSETAKQAIEKAGGQVEVIS